MAGTATENVASGNSAMVARNLRTRKRPVFNSQGDVGTECPHGSVLGWLQPESGFGAVFGAPGRARSAHIMLFRPIWAEGAGEECAPKAFDLGGEARLV